MNEEQFYFSDLTHEAQQRYLRAQGLTCAAEGNLDLDIVPLFSVDCCDKEDRDE